MNISVIIPTYNRPKSLHQALQSLMQQWLADLEILVVDNAADPKIERLVEEFNQAFIEDDGSCSNDSKRNEASNQKARRKARYIPEPRLGLHNARHAGVRAAKGDIMVFTDDDATFNPRWLDAYVAAFAEHPEMIAAGGPVRAVWEKPPPRWLLEYMDGSKSFPIFSLRELYQEFRIGKGDVFFGVNMAIRRSVFEKTGFHPELVGTRTIGDGESGLGNDIIRQGGLIGYVPQAVVYHHISSSRMSVPYIRRWAWHLGGAEMYGRWRHRRRGLLAIAKEAMRVIGDYWRNWLRAYLVRQRRDREAIDLQFQASLGWSKLVYLWWMLTDPLVQQALDMSDFRP